MQSDYIIVLTTVGSQEIAEDLAKGVIGERLAACVQIQRIESFYTWIDDLEHGNEHLLAIKTRLHCLKISLDLFYKTMTTTFQK
jgi:periplasmic divalent cation tolerance protein